MQISKKSFNLSKKDKYRQEFLHLS